mmetsp:Transcript_6585/g.14267  ORF Transcript_6585/g.14267 Transcript_6585/m.14267 type:complete len:219 (+) Transcript_6585:3-659(+)
MQVLLDARVRECDLLQAQMQLTQASVCWALGLKRHPLSMVLRIELGNVLSQLGRFHAALQHYQVAREQGSYLALLNVAHILEIQGLVNQSRAAFSEALQRATTRGLPTYHVKVRLATVLPRIAPPIHQVQALRAALGRVMAELLGGAIEVDNSPPLYSGFSTGYHLLFHGEHGNGNGDHGNQGNREPGNGAGNGAGTGAGVGGTGAGESWEFQQQQLR